MKSFLEFSLEREQKVFNIFLGLVNSDSLSKSVKNKNHSGSFLKPKLFSSLGTYLPALLLSNGSLLFLDTEVFGKIDRLKTGTLLFEDSYSEKDQ
jgi:hypothetical protein